MKLIDDNGRETTREEMTREEVIASKTFRLVDHEGPAPFVCSRCGRQSWFLEPGNPCVVTKKNGRRCNGLFVAHA
jgi:hypothetical protein